MALFTLLVTLSSGCMLASPCGTDRLEYCGPDGDCVCGDYCSRQSCDESDEVCVAYDHEPSYGVCVEEQWANERGLPPIEETSN